MHCGFFSRHLFFSFVKDLECVLNEVVDEERKSDLDGDPGEAGGDAAVEGEGSFVTPNLREAVQGVAVPSSIQPLHTSFDYVDGVVSYHAAETCDSPKYRHHHLGHGHGSVAPLIPGP